jgi:hypothetical protein
MWSHRCSPRYAKRELRCGAYYSLIDWTDYNYPAFTKDSTRYAIKDDPARWKRFQNYFQSQINEIATQLKPDLWWFDGDWEHSAEEWEAAKVRSDDPGEGTRRPSSMAGYRASVITPRRSRTSRSKRRRRPRGNCA